MIAERYGKVANLADFVRKSQLANYEAFRAMYEGRNAKLFHPSTGIITWMSNPAQPSFVWQLYHHDLEPNSALFAVKKAAEPVHIQLNESNGDVQVVNNMDVALEKARAHLAVYNLDGTIAYSQDFDVSAAASLATSLGAVEWPVGLSTVHFVKLELRDADGKLVSENFYWRAQPEHQDDLKALAELPAVTLDAKVARRDVAGKSLIEVTLHNPGTQIALMAHVQLRRKRSGERVLPVYYGDNYVSLVPNESRTITIEAATSDLEGEAALVLVDGWNVGVAVSSAAGVDLGLNVGAQVDHWPVTGLPMMSDAK
jgi:beta-mannosidase